MGRGLSLGIDDPDGDDDDTLTKGARPERYLGLVVVPDLPEVRPFVM